MYRIVIAILCVLAWASSLHAAKEIEFNVTFECGWDGYYRPMEWTPVEIGVTSDQKEPFAGTFSLGARQDGLNTLNVAQSFVLMPDVSHPISLVTKFAFGAADCEMVIRDDRGRARWRQSRTMWDYSPQNRLLRAVHEQDMLIGLIGQGQFGLMRLPKEAACTSGRGQGVVYVGVMRPQATPWDWTGYVSLDLLVLCDPDWSQLKPQQVQAISEWVSNGGSTLLVLGQHPLPQDSPLKAAIPWQIGEPRQTQIPPEAMQAWGLNTQEPLTVTGWPLSPKPNAPIPGRIKAGTESLFGTGRIGFGRIAVLAFGPNQFSDSLTSRGAPFWTRVIAECISGGSDSSGGSTSPRTQTMMAQAGRGRNIVLASSDSSQTLSQVSGPGRSNPNPYDNSHRIGVAQSAANQVMNYLFELRQMQPLSIWWVILTLTALAVLLGPVDYWLLKRLDKQPYTWLTSTAWIAVFTVGAYYGVQWLRAGSMELRAVTVLDGIADSNCAWATCYAGVFAPRSDEYQLDGLSRNQWWSGVAPMQEEIWAQQKETGVRQIYCRQADGGNLPVSLPISIWTVQSLLCEWTPKEMPFSATITRKDGGTTIEVANTSGSDIGMGCVLFGESCADLGPVPAHSTKQFAVRTRPFRLWSNQPVAYSGRQGPNMLPEVELPRMPAVFHGVADNIFFAQGCLDRTLGMYSCLDSGTAVVCVAFEKAPAPFTIKGRQYDVNHIQYARQLVKVK
ncbi:MAG: hypothetical protein ABFE01_20890 [Phycisphaerales bacterium]